MLKKIFLAFCSLVLLFGCQSGKKVPQKSVGKGPMEQLSYEINEKTASPLWYTVKEGKITISSPPKRTTKTGLQSTPSPKGEEGDKGSYFNSDYLNSVLNDDPTVTAPGTSTPLSKTLTPKGYVYINTSGKVIDSCFSDNETKAAQEKQLLKTTVADLLRQFMLKRYEKDPSDAEVKKVAGNKKPTDVTMTDIYNYYKLGSKSDNQIESDLGMTTYVWANHQFCPGNPGAASVGISSKTPFNPLEGVTLKQTVQLSLVGQSSLVPAKTEQTISHNVTTGMSETKSHEVEKTVGIEVGIEGVSASTKFSSTYGYSVSFDTQETTGYTYKISADHDQPIRAALYQMTSNYDLSEGSMLSGLTFNIYTDPSKRMKLKVYTDSTTISSSSGIFPGNDLVFLRSDQKY